MSALTDPANGNTTAVGEDRRAQVASKSSPLQHIVSEENQQAYQVSGECDLIAGTDTALVIKNTSTDKNAIVTFIRLQVIDITGFAEAATYTTLVTGIDVASGGAGVTSTNMYLGHSNSAEVTATSGSTPIVESGTAVEFDRWYPEKDADKEKYGKEGVLIIPPQKTLAIQITSGTAAGTLHARVSFIMEAPDT